MAFFTDVDDIEKHMPGLLKVLCGAIINFSMNMEAKILIMITMMCYEEVWL